MKRTELDRNILTVEKFLDAAAEPDLAIVLEGFGINVERVNELETLLQNVKQRRLETDVQLARQKSLTVRKDQLKRDLNTQIRRLTDLIRSRYPKASWLSQLGLETRYQTVTTPGETNGANENGEAVGSESSRRKAVRRGKSEAEYRSMCFILLENLSELDPDVIDFLISRGWTEERISGVKALLAEFSASCEVRDSNRRLYFQKEAELGLAVKSLRDRYRSYSRQTRLEADGHPSGQKLVAATSGWTR